MDDSEAAAHKRACAEAGEGVAGDGKCRLQTFSD
jgi:hypothetical protein